MMFGKDKPKMSDSEKKAKLAALKEAHGMASDMMKSGLDAAKTVKVSADSKEGLKKGLKMAEKVVGEEGSDELGEQGEYDTGDKGRDEQSSGFEDQQEESMPMTEEEIDAEIQHLMELKAKLEQE